MTEMDMLLYSVYNTSVMTLGAQYVVYGLILGRQNGLSRVLEGRF